LFYLPVNHCKTLSLFTFAGKNSFLHMLTLYCI